MSADTIRPFLWLLILLFAGGMALFTATVGVAGAVLVWRALPDQVAKRRFRALSAVRASAITPGEVVKITGVVRTIEPSEAPVSGAACACWELVIEAPAGKNHWRTVAQDKGGKPFVVDDGSGEVVQVSPMDARLALRRAERGRTGFFDPARPREAELIARHGLDPGGRFGFGYRFGEGTLREGERVSVIGEVALNDTRDGPRLALVAPPGKRLDISDLPDIHG